MGIDIDTSRRSVSTRDTNQEQAMVLNLTLRDIVQHDRRTRINSDREVLSMALLTATELPSIVGTNNVLNAGGTHSGGVLHLLLLDMLPNELPPALSRTIDVTACSSKHIPATFPRYHSFDAKR